jgi:hypothetical protein
VLKLIDFIIDKLTELLIQVDEREKELGKAIYVKKTDCYRDLIKFFKMFK